jgi:lincosamide nucleotidyltransferase B/F
VSRSRRSPVDGPREPRRTRPGSGSTPAGSQSSPSAEAEPGTTGQDALDTTFRDLFRADDGVRAAMAYGSRPAGLGDAHSDVEYWVFVDDTAPGSWSAQELFARAGSPDLVVRNEFGAWVAVFSARVRVEVHVCPASDTDVVRDWPARGAPVEAMVVVDRDGRLTAALADLPTLAAVPATAGDVAELCGRFANWWLLGRNVLARGELERALDALSHVRRHLLWMARLDEGTTARWLTPSRLAERDLPAETIEELRRIRVATTADELAAAYMLAWTIGATRWRALARTWRFELPRLVDRIADEVAEH